MKFFSVVCIGLASGTVRATFTTSCDNAKVQYESQCCEAATGTMLELAVPSPPSPSPMTVHYDPLQRRALQVPRVTRNSSFTPSAPIDLSELKMDGRHKTPGFLLDNLYIVWGSDFIRTTSVVAVNTVTNSVEWILKRFVNGGAGSAGYVNSEEEEGEEEAPPPTQGSSYLVPTDLSQLQVGDTLPLEGVLIYPGAPGAEAEVGYYGFANNYDVLFLVPPRSIDEDSMNYRPAEPAIVFRRTPGTLEYTTVDRRDFVEAELIKGTTVGRLIFDFRFVILSEANVLLNANWGFNLLEATGVLKDFYKPGLDFDKDFPQYASVENRYMLDITSQILNDLATPPRTESVVPTDLPRIAMRSMHLLETNKLFVVTGDAHAVIDAHTGTEILSRLHTSLDNLGFPIDQYSVMGMGVLEGILALLGCAEANYHFRNYDQYIHPPLDAGGKVVLFDYVEGVAKWVFETNPTSFRKGDMLPMEAFVAGQQSLNTRSTLHDGMEFTSDTRSGTRPQTRSPRTRLRAGRLVLEAGTVIPANSFFHVRSLTLTGASSSMSLHPTMGEISALAEDMQCTFLEEKFDFSATLTDVESTFHASDSYEGFFEAENGGRHWVKTKGEVFLDAYTTSSAGNAMDLHQEIVTTYFASMAGRYAFQTNNEARQFNFWGAGMWQNGQTPLLKTKHHPDGLLVFNGGGGSRVPHFIADRHRYKMDAVFIEFLRVQIGSMLIETSWDRNDATAFEAARQRFLKVLHVHHEACTTDPMHAALYVKNVTGMRQKDYVDTFLAFAAETSPSPTRVIAMLSLAQEYQQFCHHLSTMPEFASPLERRSTQGSVFGLDVRDGSLVFLERLHAPDNYYSPGLDYMAINPERLVDYGGIWLPTTLQPLEVDWLQKYLDFPGYNSDYLNAPSVEEVNGHTYIVMYGKTQYLQRLEVTDLLDRQLSGVSDKGITGVRDRLPVRSMACGHAMPLYTPGGVGSSWAPTLTEGAFYGGVTHTSPVPFVIHGQVVKPHTSYIFKVDLHTFTVQYVSFIPRLAHQPGTLLVNSLLLTTDAFGEIHMFDKATGDYVRALSVNPSEEINYKTDTNLPIINAQGTHLYWLTGSGWSEPGEYEFDPIPYNYNNSFFETVQVRNNPPMNVWDISTM